MVAASAGGYLVVAFFETRAAAHDAMRTATIEDGDGVREGRIGLFAPDDRGRPEVLHDREYPDERVGIEVVLDAIASALRGGVMPARSHFFDGRSDLSTDDIVRFGVELDAGHAAVAALAPRRRADRILVLLAGLGGKTELHRLSGRALRDAASAVGVPP